MKEKLIHNYVLRDFRKGELEPLNAYKLKINFAIKNFE